MAHYTLKHYAQAEKDFNDAIALDPADANYYYNRANTRRDSGNAAGALEDINRAIELRPEVAAYYHSRGLTYEEMGG